MTIKTYRYFGQPNKITKSLGSVISTLTGTFRGPFDVLNPSFEIQVSSDVYNVNYNYIEVVELSRFYFVTNYRREITNIITLELSEDLCKTFQSSLLNTRCLFGRSENLINDSIPDEYDIILPEEFTVKMQPTNNPVVFKNMNEIMSPTLDADEDLRIVLRTTNTLWQYGATPTDFEILKPTTLENLVVMTPKALNRYLEKLKSAGASILQAAKDVMSITILPFAINKSSAFRADDRVDSMRGGFLDNYHIDFVDSAGERDAHCYRLRYFELQGTIVWTYDFPNDWTRTPNYLNLPNYKKFAWECLPFGQHEINTSTLFGCDRLQIIYKYDFTINTGVLYYHGEKPDSTQTAEQYIGNFSIGTDLKLVYKADEGQNALGLIGSSIGAVGGAIGASASLISAIGVKSNKSSPGETEANNVGSDDKKRTNQQSVSGALVSATGKFVSGAQQVLNQMSPHNEQIGQCANGIIVTTTKPYLYLIYKNVKRINSAIVGRPSMEEGTISNQTGFFQASHIFWETFSNSTLPLTLDEQMQLTQILTGGAFK